MKLTTSITTGILTLAMLGSTSAASAVINSNSPSSGIEASSPRAQVTGQLEDFPTRKVVIIQQNRANNYAFDQYMAMRLKDLFKYPYYTSDIRSTNSSVDQTSLMTIAQEDAASGQEADIYISPRTLSDQYYTFRPIGLGRFFDDGYDELYVRAAVKGSLYYYNTATRQGGTITKGYYGTEDTLTMPSHRELYKEVTDKLLKQLPYQRIPKDIPRYGQEGYQQKPKSITPEQFLQVEQPRNTKYDLTGVSVL